MFVWLGIEKRSEKNIWIQDDGKLVDLNNPFLEEIREESSSCAGINLMNNVVKGVECSILKPVLCEYPSKFSHLIASFFLA